MNNPIYRGDDTNSFGQNWCYLDVDIPDTWVVSAAEFKVGNLPSIWIDNPVFPLEVNLSSDQTNNLKDVNVCYLSLYDEEGRKQTCEGSFTQVTKRRVV